MTFRRLTRSKRALSLLILGITMIALLVPPVRFPGATAQDQEPPPPSGEVIVVLKDDQPTGTMTAASAGAGVEPELVFTEVFDGFSATVTQAEAQALADDPRVDAIYPNERFWQATQTLPTGVDRIDAEENPSADIDRIDDVRINTDVAVLDSGISQNTGDLNVVGGTDCAGGLGPYDDGNGHGTHVAGTIGALDNTRGVVGVAPGARLWSVRVLNSFGNGSTESLICGLDWVARRASVIDVVNMSIQGPGEDGDCDNTAFHRAICAVVNDADIPVIVAAGNNNKDAKFTVPAAFDEVIAVSNFADFDGDPGGASTNNGCSATNQDDHFASTSNWGADIDIAAPGVCIRSLGTDGGTVLRSGTSMSAPHVTGAAALYLAANPGTGPAAVRAWLVGNAKAQSSPEGFTGDPDDFAEPVVWLGGGDPVPTATPTEIPDGAWPLVRSGASPNSLNSVYVRDGDIDTSWRTKPFADGPPDEAWVWVDLGSRKPVGTIRWVFGQAGIGDYFEIEGSNNLLTWEYITKRNGKPVGLWQEKTLSKNYRYIRFRFENPNGDERLGGLAEIRVYAPGIEPSETPDPSPATRYALPSSGASVNSAASTYVRDSKLSPVWKTKLFRGGPPDEAWVWVDLGTTRPIGTIRWVFGEAGIGDYFEIEGSNNLTSWTYVTKRNGKPVGVWQEKTLGASYRYVRFRFENPNRDLYLGGLAEVQVWSPGATPPMSSAAPPPSATSTPVPTATSVPEGPYPLYGSGRSSNSTLPRDVWDGNPATIWQTDGTGTPTSAYVFVTLGQVKPIGTIRWLYGTGEIGDDLTIQVSNDLVTWTDVHAAGNAPVDEWQAASFEGLEAKYVRWRFANPNGDPVIGGLAEVEIYAPEVYQGSDASPIPVETATPVPTETVDAASPEPIASETETDHATPVNPEPEPSVSPTEAATEVAGGPTPYPIAQTSRSASTVPGTTAVDGDPATVWGTADGVEPGRVAILRLELAGDLPIGEVWILPGPAGLRGSATVEVSDDGITWSYFGEPDITAGAADGWLPVRTDSDATDVSNARFVRVVFVGVLESNHLGGVAEIQLFPPESSRSP